MRNTIVYCSFIRNVHSFAHFFFYFVSFSTAKQAAPRKKFLSIIGAKHLFQQEVRATMDRNIDSTLTCYCLYPILPRKIRPVRIDRVKAANVSYTLAKNKNPVIKGKGIYCNKKKYQFISVADAKKG